MTLEIRFSASMIRGENGFSSQLYPQFFTKSSAEILPMKVATKRIESERSTDSGILVCWCEINARDIHEKVKLREKVTTTIQI
jgi:hypothetical protein